MKTIFDFNRAGLLIRRYFTERSHTEMIYWGIMTIVFMLIRNNPANIGALLFVAGAFFASRFFREIHSPVNKINYFMIPATQLEKITVSIGMIIVYYFGMFLMTYVIGNLLGSGLSMLLSNVDFLSPVFGTFHPAELNWRLFEISEHGGIDINNQVHVFDESSIIWMIFRVFLVTQSIFMLGGLYFKRNQTLKTAFSLTVVGFAFLILLILILQAIGWKQMLGPVGVSNEEYVYLWKAFKIITKVFFYLLVPFLWVTSYFRLTEKEV